MVSKSGITVLILLGGKKKKKKFEWSLPWQEVFDAILSWLP